MLYFSREQVRGIFVKEVEDMGDPLAEMISGREDSDRTSELTGSI